MGIIEDQKETREMLTALINGSEGFVCSVVCENAEDAIMFLPETPPDVVLVDIHLPGRSGIDCVTELRIKCTGSQFIMCTSLDDATSVFAALQAGASGYLLNST